MNIEIPEHFVDGSAAARALNAREGTTKFTSGGISKSVSKGCKCNGWHFASAVSAEDEAKAARDCARVRAAIAAMRRP